MNSSGNKVGSGAGKVGPSAAASMTSGNSSLLLDKFNNVRRSTPDSEALASSDDEGDRHDQTQPVVPPQKPVRRSSWLNETAQPGPQPRKGSFASSSMSPTTSHPNTPSAESSSWAHPQTGNGVGRGVPGANSFPWGGGIWNSESRKEPPSRLTEVLPSPTSIHPPGTAFFNNDLNNNQQRDSRIPFDIPLHPTPKTYRSQSYSVGQLDPDLPTSTPSSNTGPMFSGRGRPLQHSGLQHRPSRPSMLSEMSSEGGLGKVKEVDDDDDESTNGSNHGVALPSSEASKTIELLARENAILRQQNIHNSRLRPRSSTSSAYANYGLQETLPEESDYAIDELDEISELQEITSKGLLGRRMSEYGAAGQPKLSAYAALENRKLENVKRANWQSSLGFGGLGDIPQSRRHSFADVPTRQGSVSSVGDALSVHESSLQESLSPKDYYGRYPEGYSLNEHAASYFGGGIATLQRDVDPYGSANYQPSAYPYGSAQYGGGRVPSPHRSMYGVPQPRHNQPLYIVLFKCSRADVFYVQEGTGLEIKPGDLVIVEADRGTDLGTVAKHNVDWVAAKELKEHYAEEHYKWLMMYSQGAAGTADGTGAGLMAASNGLQGSAVGGMGPPSQHGMQEPNSGEIKPKIIKRLAQNHEIQALRDKEGNEAKAKRVCMQKVKEHGLHMEILDAEFQMDWKKLTFYYFADAYINFNSLVTDLFKVYKTRIWMSAINPASFASPSLGLQAPSGIGPGAVGVTRNTPSERRAPQAEPASYAAPQASRGYQNVFAQPFSSGLDRGAIPQTAFQPSGFSYGFSPFGAATPRNVVPGGYGPIDTFGAFQATTDYQGLPARFPSPHGTTPTHDAADYSRGSNGLSTSNETWINNFQGLSMRP